MFYTTDGRLRAVRGPRPTIEHENAFTYDANGRLAWISDKYDPGGDPPDWYGYSYDSGGPYDSGGRLNLATDPEGWLTQRFTYLCKECTSSAGSRTRTLNTYYTDRRGNDWRYDYGIDLDKVEPTAYLYEISGPESVRRAFGYDEDHNLRYFCDRPSGVYNCWNSTYDANGNRLSLTDPLGHVQSWTYDWFNNVTSSTDGARNVTEFYYDLAAGTPSYPTLLTRIIECPVALDPGVTECPPSSDPPTTTMAYYLGTDPLDNGFGQLKEVIDPNLVWTGFEYDRWGQLLWYREGKIETQTASISFVVEKMTQADSGGRTVETGGSGGGGGSSDYDANNNPTGSTCLPFWAGASAAQAPTPSGAFPAVPCTPTAPPVLSAGFSNAEYSAKGELTDLPVTLTVERPGVPDPDLYSRRHTAEFDALGRQTLSKIMSDESGADVPRQFDYTYNWGAGTYARTGPDGVETYVQLDDANRVQYVRRGSEAAPLMTASYTYLGNDLIQSVTYGNGSGGNGASTWYTYDAARRVTRIEHQDAGGGVLLALDYDYYPNDLPSSIACGG